MKIKNLDTKTLIKLTMVTALYVVLTAPAASISYGPVQFRIAEILNLLVLVNPLYLISVTIGCGIANFFSFGLIDVVFGSMATFMAGYCMIKTKNIWVASLWPSVFNGIIISLELMFIAGLPFWITAGSIALSEFIIMTVIGVPVYKLLIKNKQLMNLLKLN